MSEVSPLLQHQLDRRAIAYVVSAYARAVDARDWPALAACFTDDCVVEYPASGRAEGPDQVVERCRRAVDPLDATRHEVTALVLGLAGGTTTSVCTLVAEHLRGGRSFVVGGRYHDAWRRTPGGWRIARRRLERTWTAGDRDVLDVHQPDEERV